MKKLLVLLLLPIGWGIWKYQSTHHPDLPGYQVDAGEIQREHEKIYGNPLDSAEIDKGFAGARAYVHRAQYRDAIMFFRSANKIAALPIFYNNLGTLYVATHDFPKAITAFHQALNRDPTYQPAIDNLNELKKRPEGQLAVLEAEPNNNPDLANDFAFDLPVAATIEAGLGDTDVYALTTPPAPRDLFEVKVENHNANFAPRLRVLDSDGIASSNWDFRAEPGASIAQVFTAKPNTQLFLEVSGSNHTGGSYHISAHALKAFDAHEPNDTIFEATPVQFGKTLNGNIMDQNDNDYFSFIAANSGAASVLVGDESGGLSPGVTIFGPDRTTLQFGPTVLPGNFVRLTVQVDGGHPYYVQVWSQNGTAGPYGITVTQP